MFFNIRGRKIHLVLKRHVKVNSDVIVLGLVISKARMLITDTQGHYQNLREYFLRVTLDIDRS